MVARTTGKKRRSGIALLTAKTCAQIKQPGRYADGGNLYLQVQQGGRGITKSWLFRYTVKGKAREMGLGPVHTLSLAEARALAQEHRKLLLRDIDPLEARDAAHLAAELAAGKSKAFKECALAYIAANRATWKNEKHAAQWENTLETYAYPKIGLLRASAIDTPHVVDVLAPIWTSKNETAMRLRGRIEAILDWATVMKCREGLNPARWRGNLDQALPKISRAKRIRHHAAMPFERLPAFMRELRAQQGVAARALEFTILTAARTGETIGAGPAEIDERALLWTVPAHRMKGDREHRVPLSKRALALAKECRVDDVAALFPGRAAGGLSNMAMLKLLDRMGHSDLTVHGFRSSFRDWAAERTNFPRDVVEMALAHAIEDKTEAAYRRGELIDKRRKLMDAWAEFCEKGTPATLHSLDQRRASKKA